MWNYKIAMAKFPNTFQCQDGSKVFKCYEWRCQGFEGRFRKPKHTKEHIKKDYIRYFVKKILNIMNLSQNLSYNRFSVWSSGIDRRETPVNMSKTQDCELNLSPTLYDINNAAP